MKKILKYSFAYILFLFVFSCSKDRNQVRVNNTFSNAVHVVVGPVDYGQVQSVTITDYKSMPVGNQTISGDINGSITIPSSGRHKYTININTVGGVTLIDDSNN